jgi:hypothetical protein
MRPPIKTLSACSAMATATLSSASGMRAGSKVPATPARHTSSDDPAPPGLSTEGKPHDEPSVSVEPEPSVALDDRAGYGRACRGKHLMKLSV